MPSTSTAVEYRENYATVKRRGFDESNSEYTVTVHKRFVRRGRYQFAEDCPSDRYAPKFPRGFRAVGADVVGGAVSSDGFNEALARFESSLSRSKSVILQAVANNKWDWFVTFTLSAEKVARCGLSRYDLTGMKKKIMKFLNNYRTRYGLRDDDGNPLFRYLLVPEFHKDGAVHYHGVMKGIHPDDLATNWKGDPGFTPMEEKFGLSYMEHIGDAMARAAYISKYIGKQMFAGAQLLFGQSIDPHKNLYFCSKGLKRDELIAEGEPCFNVNDMNEREAVTADDGEDVPVKSTYDNEWIFKVTFEDKNFALSLIRPMLRVYDAPRVDRKAYEAMFEDPRFRGCSDSFIAYSEPITDLPELAGIFGVPDPLPWPVPGFEPQGFWQGRASGQGTL